MEKKFKFALISIMLFPMLVKASESINYCHDEAKNQHWEQAIKQHKDNKTLQTLYALRRGLCAMIDEGKIGLDDAIDLFEAHRERLLPNSEPEGYDKPIYFQQIFQLN